MSLTNPTQKVYTKDMMKGVLQRLTQVPLSRLFIVLALVIGAALAVLNPPMTVVDEESHFFRAYEVAQGNWKTDRQADKKYGAIIPKNLAEYVYGNKQNAFQDPTARQGNEYQLFGGPLAGQRPDERQKVQVLYNGAAVYSPVVYLPQALGIKLALLLQLPIVWLILLGRIMNYLLFIVVGYWALKTIKRGAYIVFVVLLLPMVLFQAMSLSADTPTLLATIVAFTLFMNILVRRTMQWSAGEITLLIIASTVIALGKVVYLPLILGAFGALWFVKSVKSRRIRGRTALALIPILVAGLVAGGSYMAWSRVNHDAIEHSQALFFDEATQKTISSKGQLQYIAGHLPAFTRDFLANTLLYNDRDVQRGMIGRLGYTDWQVTFPTWAVALAYVSLGLAAFVRQPDDAAVPLSRRRRKVLAAFLWGLAIATCVGTYVLMYLIFNPIGSGNIQGVQGRYFIPVLLYAAAGVLLLVRSISSSRHTQVKAFIVISTMVTSLVMIAIISGYYR